MRKAALMLNDAITDRFMSGALEKADYACVMYGSATALLRAVRRTRHDAVLIEADTAGDWKAVLERRGDWLEADVPLVLVGVPGTGACALEAGADDFVCRPVDATELVARLQAATRRRSGAASAPITLQQAGCAIDERTRSLTSTRERVALTPRELAVARILFSHAGQRVSRRQLAVSVWGSDEDISARTIEQHMYQLRRKLRRCIGEALTLRSVYGGGYCLEVTGGAAK